MSVADLIAALGRVDGKAEIVDGEAVVWDVDVLQDGGIAVYRATAPELPTVYVRGETAEAEPALPGWTVPVDDLFD